MKKVAIALAVSLAGITGSYAATVVGTNDPGNPEIVGGEARGFFDTSGTALSGGYAGIGFFSTMPDFATDTGASIESMFTRLGNSGSFNKSVSGTDIPGIFSLTASGQIIDGGQGSEFIGQNIFLVIGDGDSIAASSELFVLDSGNTFAEDNPTFNASVDLTTDDTPGTILHGSEGFSGGSLSTSAGDFDTSENSFQTAVLIPEPSTALLGLLGFLGVMRRRR